MERAEALPGGGPARQSYLICTTPRTGSWFLCRALARTGVAGAPSEYFYTAAEARWCRRLQLAADAPYGAYVDALLMAASTSNGVFGAKVMWHYTSRFLDAVGDVDAALPDLRFVHLERGDRAAQAVSLWRATVTNGWAAGLEATDVPPYDFDAIARHHADLSADVESWRRWFAARDVSPLELRYEEVVADHETAVRSVLAHLDIDADGVPMPAPELARQADDLSTELIERFRSDLDARG